MKKVLIIILILGLLSSISFSQTNPLGKIDGNDWISNSKSLNIGLVSGIILGSSTFEEQIIIHIRPVIDKSSLEEINKKLGNIISQNNEEKTRMLEIFNELKLINMLVSLSYLEKIMEDLDSSMITVGQFYDGLDSFYNNYANRRIKVMDAFYIVKMQINGKSSEFIEAQTRYLRMMPEVMNQSSENYTKIQEFMSSKEKIKKALLEGKITKENFIKAGYFVDDYGETYPLFCYGHYK